MPTAWQATSGRVISKVRSATDSVPWPRRAHVRACASSFSLPPIELLVRDEAVLEDHLSGV